MKKSTLVFLMLFTFTLIASMVACAQLLTSSSSQQTTPIHTDSLPTEITEVEEYLTDPYKSHYTWLADSFLVHVTGGIPFDSDTTDDYLIYRPQYVLSYNAKRGVPNWVSWQLDASWYGNSGRYSGNFITDRSLPNSFYKPKHSDYTNSGYDRGHVVRSHERTRNNKDNRSTFLMSNIVPQTPHLNRGVWLGFERFCESLCLDSGLQLLVISGGVYSQNRSLKDLGQISIPDSCYKIVVAIDRKMELSTIDSSTRMYCVMMPNIDGIMNDPWENYRTNVQHIEKATGYRFLERLSMDIQGFLESK